MSLINLKLQELLSTKIGCGVKENNIKDKSFDLVKFSAEMLPPFLSWTLSEDSWDFVNLIHDKTFALTFGEKFDTGWMKQMLAQIIIWNNWPIQKGDGQ